MPAAETVAPKSIVSSYNVEYGPDCELTREFPASRYGAACAFARRESDKHGSAYVVAYEYRPDEDGQRREQPCGHIGFWGGSRSEVEGIVRAAA